MITIKPKDIKVGMIIQDGLGNKGKVEENIHPWGFKRLQYNGLTIINHPNTNWYKLIR